MLNVRTKPHGLCALEKNINNTFERVFPHLEPLTDEERDRVVTRLMDHPADPRALLVSPVNVLTALSEVLSESRPCE